MAWIPMYSMEPGLISLIPLQFWYSRSIARYVVKSIYAYPRLSREPLSTFDG